MNTDSQNLLDFLNIQNVQTVGNAGYDIETLISLNFNSLSEPILRSLVDKAIQERDINLTQEKSSAELLGSWGKVIDAIKNETEKRREAAFSIMQTLIRLEQEKKSEALRNQIIDFYKQGLCDRFLMELLQESLQASKQHNQMALSKCILTVIVHINKHIKDIVEVDVNGKQTESKEKFMTTISKSADIKAIDESTDSDDEVEEIDQETTNKLKREYDNYQHQLYETGNYVHKLISSCSGDAKRLKDIIISDLHTHKIDLNALKQVLQDNIDACEAAGYVNKLKLFQYIKTALDSFNSSKSPEDILTQKENAQAAVEDSEDSNGAALGATTYHVPKFINNNEHIRNNPEITQHKHDTLFLEASAVALGLVQDTNPHANTNKKKKNLRKNQQTKMNKLIEQMKDQLDKYGWAVCDNFLPLELVRRVRLEASLFKDHYEQSEIWVGKQADVGAQISVPSVRGDRVLWVCGGRHHRAVENPDLSRTIRTRGEVEPCKLDVKAQSPLKRFNAVKELIVACDGIMGAMRAGIPDLSGIFDRSDVMFAVYPGEGSRFANHIDNTTGDGRKITMLFYLNPDWAPELGGALRVTGRDGNVVDVYPDAGRLVVFYSSEIPHEVLPTFGDRYAATIWFYDRDERQKAVEESVRGGKAMEAHAAGPEAQAKAKKFIADLMGGDDVGDDGGDPSVTELSELVAKVSDLNDEVLGIVASITGAPSTESFREGFPMLTTNDLKSMRSLFRRMGLNS